MSAIRLDFDPSGLLFNAERGVLYIADTERQRIVAFDGTDFRTHAELPPVKAANGGLGQLASDRDDRLFVSRYGFGGAGGIFAIGAAACSPLVGLDPKRKRVGLTVAPDGVMFSSFFLDCHASNTGAVACFTQEGEESVILSELAKPVALLADRDSILVSDQTRDRIAKVSRDSPHAMEMFAEVPQPDALCAGPEGRMFAASKTGAVYQISPGQAPRAVARDLRQPRGLAYDPRGGWLFIADRDGGPLETRHHYLRILPI
jgi:hypothetical protein